MKSFINLSLLLFIFCPVQPTYSQVKPLPVIDMHLHALRADEQGKR